MTPDPLIAAIVTAGTASRDPAVTSAGTILDRYDRILDALAHTPLAVSTEFEIEFDHERWTVRRWSRSGSDLIFRRQVA